MMGMCKDFPFEILLAGDYKQALGLIDRKNHPLEAAYACFLAGQLIESEAIIKNLDSTRANWLKNLVALMKTGEMPSPTYFQIRSFLELDIDLLIRAQKVNYLEKIFSYAEILTDINNETYKLIARVLFNNNLISLAKYYFDLYKDVLFYDPELHFMYAKYYILKHEYENALSSINHCLYAMPKYFPALKLRDEIVSLMNEK